MHINETIGMFHPKTLEQHCSFRNASDRTSFNHVGLFHDSGICQFFLQVSQTKLKNIFSLFIHLHWHLEIWVESYSWHYLQESVLILRTIHMEHCSTWYYSLKNKIHNNTIVENTDNVHNVLQAFITFCTQSGVLGSLVMCQRTLLGTFQNTILMYVHVECWKWWL